MEAKLTDNEIFVIVTYLEIAKSKCSSEEAKAGFERIIQKLSENKGT